MEKSLLVVERVVLESLEKGPLCLKGLKDQTGLSQALLKAVVFELINRGVVHYASNLYQLNWSDKENWMPLVKNREGMKAEIKELFSSLVNQKYKKEEDCILKVQKIWLEPEEQKDLERRLKDIDFFIEGIRQRRRLKPVRENTSKKQVLFYGASTYENLLGNILQAS